MITDNEPNIENNIQGSIQEAYLKSMNQLEEGQLVEGTIIQISNDQVFVDVGYKSEGKIPIEEFAEKPSMGDVVNVILVRKETRDGNVVVSKKKADEKVYWKTIKQAFQENTPVPGKFKKAIKGGYEVDLGHGYIAFNPLSKADVVRVEDPETLVGVESPFMVERLYSDNRVKLVVSRRSYLIEETNRKREQFFTSVQIGDDVVGIVKSFTSFGAFIDLGGFDGLLHINDMSWGHVTRPKDFVKKGQEIQLKVIKLDHENHKINLSLKHFTPDPWSIFEDKHFIDEVIKGKVTKLTDFGAFIEIEEGIEGLAHISELSWVKRIKHPSEVLQIGDDVEAKILNYDLEHERVSLGVKQVLPNPWDDLQEKYPVGMQLNRTIKKITNAGAFIELEEGIDGFLHVDDLSWTKKIKNPGSMLKEGENVDVAIISLDNENRRIRLGVKQLSDDPWISLQSTTPKGTVVEGEITNVTDFGIFVRVSGDIEGLINKHNLAENSEISPEEQLTKFKAGDKVKAMITDINTGGQRLSLSIREYQRSIQRAELSKYIHDEENESTFTLGDALKTPDEEE